MPVDFKKARDFVYSNGVLWERDLFAYLFLGGELARVHNSLRAYRNSDGGYGNAMEHDIRCTQSHPLALEFLLQVLAQTNTPVGDLLDTAATWVEKNQAADGSLINPPEVLDYPHAPWWNGGGQTIPDSIVGNLVKFGKANDTIRQKTAQWTAENLTADKIRANEWLFMAYHAYEYWPELDEARCKAAVENIVSLAVKAPEDQFYSLMRFVPTPDSPVAQALPAGLLARVLDYLEHSQQEDGGWNDQHGLPQWRPYVTITNLLALRNHGRNMM